MKESMYTPTLPPTPSLFLTHTRIPFSAHRHQKTAAAAVELILIICHRRRNAPCANRRATTSARIFSGTNSTAMWRRRKENLLCTIYLVVNRRTYASNPREGRSKLLGESYHRILRRTYSTFSLCEFLCWHLFSMRNYLTRKKCGRSV